MQYPFNWLLWFYVVQYSYFISIYNGLFFTIVYDDQLFPIVIFKNLDSQAITKSMKIYICTNQSTQDTSLASYGTTQM